MATQHFQHRDGKVVLVEWNPMAGWDWHVWGASPGGKAITGHSETLERAREDAELAAGFAPPKPSDPAWMAEVADLMASEAPNDLWARETAFRALRLAIERGHVVERREARRDGNFADWLIEVAKAVEDEGPLSHRYAACRAIELAMLRGRLAAPRPMPSEDELLKAAREDAAQAYVQGDLKTCADEARRGGRDGAIPILAALQARRNMLKEMGVVDPDFREVGEPVKWGDEPAKMARKAALNAVRPSGDIATFYTAGEPGRVDLEEALKRAWEAGCKAMEEAVRRTGSVMLQGQKERDMSAILSTLPAKE